MWSRAKPTRRAKGTKIVWTSRPKIDDLPTRQRDLKPSFKDQNVAHAVKNPIVPSPWVPPDERLHLYEAALSVGSTFVTTTDLSAGVKGSYPFTLLVPRVSVAGGTVLVPTGSLVMYAGSLRCTERKAVCGPDRYVDVQAVKHTFITPYGRCIIHDFHVIVPA